MENCEPFRDEKQEIFPVDGLLVIVGKSIRFNSGVMGRVEL